jgi:UDP-N-acetylglucosamine--N-acetylmuramyl-(pentapeptide) pyrophosphoryl-undecaprenol N-acetylglucosamine transferase
MKMLAVGGGSGGHVTPVLAVINELAKSDDALQVWFVCDKAFESQSRGIMARADVPVQVSTILAGKFRRYTHLTRLRQATSFYIVSRNLLDIFKVAVGFLQSIILILRVKPDVVFAKGGYVSLPLGLAARLLGCPLVIHDSDTRPGLTNRILSRYATQIATGSPLKNYPYDPQKSQYVGVPIGNDFAPVSTAQQHAFKRALGVDPTKKLVVATGGGLGASSINLALVKAARSLSARGIAVYSITGKSHYDDVAPMVTGIADYAAVPFVYEKMHEVLGAADVVISRASATFLQELAGLAKAVIAVPARHLGDQLKNAEVYKDAGAAIIMTDHEIGIGDDLESTIVRLMSSDAERRELGAKLHEFARPNAAHDLAQLILGAAKQA